LEGTQIISDRVANLGALIICWDNEPNLIGVSMEVPLDDGSSSLRASFEQIKRLTAKGFNVESYS